MSASRLAKLFLKSISLEVVTVLFTSTDEWEGLDLRGGKRLLGTWCEVRGGVCGELVFALSCPIKLPDL